VTCREFAEFIADYLSGELPGDARASFERHLGNCPTCVAYLSNYRDTIALGRTAFAKDDADADADAGVPGDVPDDLIRAILDSRRDRG
jgi:anti-sigma factor RsiW